MPFASVGDGSTIGGVNITLDDAAASLLPAGSPLVSGTYKPTSKTGGTSLVFPAPAPLISAGNYAITDGTATFSSTFDGTAPNGTWALYAIDNSGNGAASIGGGWCVNVTPSSTTVPITITTSPANLLVSADGGQPTAAPLTENWVPGSPHTIATSSPQAGGTGVQYVWSNWSDSGAISHSITVPSTATTYTASFGTQYLLTTAANPTNGGTVTPPSGMYYAASTVVALTATPNANYTFSSWTGNVANANNASTTVTMSGPQSVTANFAAATSVTVSPTSLMFPNTYVGLQYPMVVIVKNVSTSKVLIGPISISVTQGDSSDFILEQGGCVAREGKELAVGMSCKIGVIFQPDAAGTDTATLNITAGGAPIAVPMTGTGKNKK